MALGRPAVLRPPRGDSSAFPSFPAQNGARPLPLPLWKIDRAFSSSKLKLCLPPLPRRLAEYFAPGLVPTLFFLRVPSPFPLPGCGGNFRLVPPGPLAFSP